MKITIQGFKKWREKTMISPFGSYFRHHHILFKPDGIQYSKDKPDCSEKILKLHHSITSIVLLNEFPILK